MNFREWLEFTEDRASVRNVPSSRGGSRPAMNQGFLRGSATTWGHTDSPDPLEKGVTAVATGVGSSIRKSLEDDAGLVVQGVGRIMGPPGMEEEMGAEYNYLPIQIPVWTHNKQQREFPIGSIDSDRIYKDILKADVMDKIRSVNGPAGMDKGVDMDGRFTLLSQDDEGNWNFDQAKAKQFTRALIYRMVREGLAPDKREMYDLDAMPEIVGEELSEDGRVLLVWFGFEKRPKKGVKS
jgi:hypothetical protein